MNYYSDNKELQFYLKHPLIKRIAEMKEQGYSQCGEFNYAPAGFDEALLGYEQVLRLVGELSADIVAPNAAKIEEEGPKAVDGRVIYAPATEEDLELFRKAGLMGVSLPRRYGGLNFPTAVFTMMQELVCRADAGFGNLWGLQDCATTIYNFGSDSQCERYLPMVSAGATMSMDLTEPDAGSDLQSARLKATYSEADDCWYLDGMKRFITNGDSDIHLVLARSEEGSVDGRGLSLFICEKSCGKVKTRRIEDKMGIHGSPTCEVVFDHAPAFLCGSRRMRPVIATGDFLLTEQFLRSRFSIKSKRIIFPEPSAREELQAKTPEEGRPALALITRNNLAAYAFSITGARAFSASLGVTVPAY